MFPAPVLHAIAPFSRVQPIGLPSLVTQASRSFPSNRITASEGGGPGSTGVGCGSDCAAATPQRNTKHAIGLTLVSYRLDLSCCEDMGPFWRQVGLKSQSKKARSKRPAYRRRRAWKHT